MKMRPLAVAALVLSACPLVSAEAPSFRVLVVASADPDHAPMIDAAPPLFESIARENGFAVDFTRGGAAVTDEGLSRYAVVVVLHMAPFDLSNDQQDALQRFVERGGGWVGVHAAGLTGKQFLAPGMRYWQWFEDFFGSVVYSPHPALQKGTVAVEDRAHPVTRNLPERFEVIDEWYEFDRSPRPNVHVLACADESTYKPKQPMGDHPIVWTHPKHERMVYVGIGHHVSMCADPHFRILMRDAILWARASAPRFRALVLAEKAQPHAAFVEAASRWLDDWARRDGFALDFVENTETIDEALLQKYQVVIQLNYPPYAWTPTAAAAFQQYVEEGRGGWVGFHHATLLGEFDGHPLWPWFWDFMGRIRWKDYIPTFVSGTVHVEDVAHPATRALPKTFVIEKEEWYTYDRSPRPNVRVLARVDEASYQPDSKIKMGDHPVIWTNERLKGRNLYIFMGHGPELMAHPAYTTLVHDAVLWAAGVEGR
jgi:type 1 glutamine amidotransferase